MRFAVDIERHARLRVEDAELALAYAARRMHLSPEDRLRCLEALRHGHTFHCAYGFTSVTITPFTDKEPA
jgi:hypothetical protein